MNRIIVRNFSKYIPSKNKTWCYRKGFYKVPYPEQYESRDNENEIKQRVKSYGKFVYENPNSTRKKRQEKVKEYLDNYYPHSRDNKNRNAETHRNYNYYTYDSEYY